jgi:hypothetical protein
MTSQAANGRTIITSSLRNQLRQDVLCRSRDTRRTTTEESQNLIVSRGPGSVRLRPAEPVRGNGATGSSFGYLGSFHRGRVSYLLWGTQRPASRPRTGSAVSSRTRGWTSAHPCRICRAISGRGRDGPCEPPPAQIPASGTTHWAPALGPGVEAEGRPRVQDLRSGEPAVHDLSVVGRKVSELDQARLLGVELETEPAHPLSQLGAEGFGLPPMLEPNHDIVRTASAP